MGGDRATSARQWATRPASNTPVTQKLLVDVREAASLLGCGRTYIYGMIQRGELPIVKLGRLTRIQVSALADFVSRHELATAVQSGCDGLGPETIAQRGCLASTCDSQRGEGCRRSAQVHQDELGLGDGKLNRSHYLPRRP